MPKKKAKAPFSAQRVGGGPEESIGPRLKKMRNGAGWSIRELAARSGIGRTALQNYEAGVRLPGVSQLRKLAQQLDCSAHFLVFGSDWKAADPSAGLSFFGPCDYDLYPFNLAAAMKALPVAEREAAERLLESLLVAAVGRERLPRIAKNANWLRFRFLEAGDELFPQVIDGGVPWDDAGMMDIDNQAAADKPLGKRGS